VSFTKALPTGVGVYGAFILLLGIALYTLPTSAPVGTPRPVTRATVLN
jgi:hypothetical protein